MGILDNALQSFLYTISTKKKKQISEDDHANR